VHTYSIVFGLTTVNNNAQSNQNASSSSSKANSDQFEAESSIVDNQFIVFFRQYLSKEKQKELLQNFLNSNEDLSALENQCENQKSGKQKKRKRKYQIHQNF